VKKILFFSVACLLIATTARAENPDQEISDISNRLNNTPSTAGQSDSRSLGLLQYPINPTSSFQKMLPDISLVTTMAGAYFTQDPTGPTGVDPSQTGFNLQEIELALQSVIDPYFRADVMLTFSTDSYELEEGYFTTLDLVKGFQVRGGKLRIPFGRQNPKHLEQWDFVDNTLITKDLLGVDGLKELGVEASYLFPTPFFLQLQGTFSNNNDAVSFGGLQKKDFLYEGRLSTSFDTSQNTSILIGGSGAFGYNPSFAGAETKMFGGDFLMKWKPKAYRAITWQSEYLFRSYEDSPGTYQRDGGLYSYVDYQFLKRWHAGIRYDQLGLPESLIAKEYRVTPAITFNPTEFTRLRLQYEFDKTTASNNTAQSAFLQVEFSMGPHGAHPF
jgi:hypothetical protein